MPIITALNATSPDQSNGSVAPATPSAAQQDAFAQSMAAAQLGTSSTTKTAASASKADVAHLVAFSMFQSTVLNAMAEVERTRQEASKDDD